MWLINARTRLLEEFTGLKIPEYAILSHTWEAGQEVTFQEFSRESRTSAKRGYWKIDQTCQQAIRDGLDYVWVDTCCIDKSSSAELSEAINSMYNWYQRASVCYVYFVDLFHPVGPDDPNLQDCRWFTRAWTLQELIAPIHVKFYARAWEFCFTKSDASAQLSRIAGINPRILRHEIPLSAICVAQKMSWARSCQATRVEDIAYSLLGIFAINMPLLYGEESKAFMRLQSEIIRSCPDLSILAWFDSPMPGENTAVGEEAISLFSTVLASSPGSFGGCHSFTRLQNHSLPDFSISNRGINIRAKFCLQYSNTRVELALPVCQSSRWTFAIRMRNVGGGCFVRQDPTGLMRLRSGEMSDHLVLNPYLLTQPLRLDSPDTKYELETILSTREYGLQVVLDPSMAIYRRWPWTKWDEVDNLFFGPEDLDLGWAALKIVSQPPGNFVIERSDQYFDFLLYVFGWARPGSEPPRCTMHKVSGTISDRALEDMNNLAVTEDWNAYWVVNRLVTHHVHEHTVVVVGAENDRSLLLTCHLSWVADHRICPNRFWRIKLSWQAVPRKQAPQMIDRGWRHLNWESGWPEPPNIGNSTT
ncbi:HET-domain-containing protein [Xylaria sp. FL0064]|nr:HET-domain-containing protein [Xylaria sp. FL0064]